MLAGAVQLVVQQALVEDPDVLRRQLGEVDRGGDGAPARALAHPLGGAGEQDEHPVDGVVVRRLGQGLQQREGALHAVPLGIAGPEQVAAVVSHPQLRVPRALVQEPEQREQAGPGHLPIAATLRRAAVELVEQATQPVGAVVDGVVGGEQLAGFGEEDHHEPHHEVAGGDVEVRPLVVAPGRADHGLPRAQERLDRATDPLPQLLAQPRLAAPGVPDGRQQGAVLGLAPGERRPGQDPPQDVQLVRELIRVEPAVGVPLHPGGGVGVGPEEAPLGAVGQQGQRRAATAQVLLHLGDGAAALPHADARDSRGEHRQGLPVGAAPEPSGLERGAVEQLLGVRSAEGAATAPRQTQAGRVGQDDVEQSAERLPLRLLGVEGHQRRPEPVREPVARLLVGREVVQRRGREQVAAVAQGGPGVVQAHDAPPGSRISTAIG